MQFEVSEEGPEKLGASRLSWSPGGNKGGRALLAAMQNRRSEDGATNGCRTMNE